MEKTPEINLEEAVFFRGKSYSANMKQNSSHCKHKGVQDQKNTLADYKYCLEIKEINMVLIILIEVINMKFEW